MIRLAAIQMSSQDQIDINLQQAKTHLITAAQQGCTLAVLPENFACFAAGQQRHTAERFDDIRQQLQQWAQQLQLWMVAGSIPCPYRPNGHIVPDQKVRSASLLIAPDGHISARYDKIHLFDAKVPDGTGRYHESATFEAGDQIVSAQTPWGHIGLMICYDLRFPELAIRLRQQGADVLCAPSAFTHVTGQQHWQLLLRARALDSQCLIVGAGQQGQHGLRQTWGHSSIADYRGEIIAERQTGGSGVLTACYDRDALASWRQAMPLMDHRRLL
jgi:predicted amidohydrolase